MKALILAAIASLFCVNVTFAQGTATSPSSAPGGAATAAEKKADSGDKKATPQQERMKSCNKEAGDKKLKDDERKAFMKDCLGGKTAAAESKGTPQQEKMKSCNKEAGDKKLKGADRKKFMGECLKA